LSDKKNFWNRKKILAAKAGRRTLCEPFTSFPVLVSNYGISIPIPDLPSAHSIQQARMSRSNGRGCLDKAPASFHCTLILPSFRRDSSRNPEIWRTGFRPRACRNDGTAHSRFGCGYPLSPCLGQGEPRQPF